MAKKRKRGETPRFSLREKLNKRKSDDEENSFWDYDEEEEDEWETDIWDSFPLNNLISMHKYLWEKTLGIIIFLIVLYLFNFFNFPLAQGIKGKLYQATIQHIEITDYSERIASVFQGLPHLTPFVSDVSVKESDESDDIEKTGILDFQFILPVEGSVAGKYGLREDPFSGVSRMCYGIDIITSPEAQVAAAAPGVVKEVGEHSIYNRMVKIEHESGISCVYGNLGEVMVEENDSVEPGDMIGFMLGEENPLLHFQLRKEGRPVDPLNFFSEID